MLNIAVWQGDAAPPFDPQLLAPLQGERWARARPPKAIAGAPPTDTTATWPPPASTTEHATWRNEAAAAGGGVDDTGAFFGTGLSPARAGEPTTVALSVTLPLVPKQA